MQFLDNIRSSKFLILGLFLPQFVILGIYFHKLYLKFLSFCPNQNFLTWDPDARLVTSIRFAEAFRSFDPIMIVRLVFDSPTWPVLRNFPEALIVLIFGPGGTPVSLFTFGELVLLFLIVPWILFRFSKQKSQIAPPLLFPLVWTGLLQNPGFMHYSFSGMLEIQGGLFFLPAVLAFWELYCLDEVEILHSSQNPNSLLQESSKQINSGFISTKSILTGSYFPWFLCISANLLFHTKYPYGYIFILFGSLFLITFRFYETKQFIFKILNFYGLFLNESSFLQNSLERKDSAFSIKNVSEKENSDSFLKNVSEERNFDSLAKNNSEKTKPVFSKENFFKRIKWRALISIGFAILLILVSAIFPKEILPEKTKAYLYYAGVLIFWISINVVVWKIFYGLRKADKDILILQFTDHLKSSVSCPEVQSVKIDLTGSGRSIIRNSDAEKNFSTWKYFWTYVIFPIGSWVLIHPDRFLSFIITTKHMQDVGLMPGQSEDSIFSFIYFREILDNSFYAPYGGWVLCVGLILGIIFGGFHYWKNHEVSASFFLFLSVFVSILGLTLVTPNHQPRHIYHLYPALLVAICIFCYEKFSEGRTKILSYLVYSVFLIFTLGYWSWKHSDIWERTNLCFSGTDRGLFFTAEDAESVFLKTVNRSSVLWNLLPLEHHNRPDIMLSFYRAGFYNRQKVREKNKKEEFDLQKIRISGSNWFIVTDRCDEIGNRIGIPFEEIKKSASETDWNPVRGACILKVGGK
ncbi:hypothetical protein [Leptospira alexanderi]|uniref:hypothetical protein n=1 Tax=Leptospira alexanderi TaxID=100053 RepID=UPI000990BE53|nr:hypothetical protein [Leptospira alexanderi]